MFRGPTSKIGTLGKSMSNKNIPPVIAIMKIQLLKISMPTLPYPPLTVQGSVRPVAAGPK